MSNGLGNRRSPAQAGVPVDESTGQGAAWKLDGHSEPEPIALLYPRIGDVIAEARAVGLEIETWQIFVAVRRGELKTLTPFTTRDGKLVHDSPLEFSRHGVVKWLDRLLRSQGRARP
ncbi:MAG: hypothetical protein WKG01_07700 [Kofleriaceae bacterium]